MQEQHGSLLRFRFLIWRITNVMTPNSWTIPKIMAAYQFHHCAPERQAALSRSLELFLQYLSNEQRNEFFFGLDKMVPGSFPFIICVGNHTKNSYRLICMTHTRNVYSSPNARSIGYCSYFSYVHQPTGLSCVLPYPDLWLGQKLLIENDECEFLAHACGSQH